MLKVSGGRYEMKGDSTLWVGSDGDGTVEMIGSSGKLVVPNMALDAKAVEPGTGDETQTKATLCFVLTDKGEVAPVTVSQNLTISADSKLVIDASACPEGLSGRVHLVDAGVITGAFAPENIIFIGEEKVVSSMSVAVQGGSIVLRRGSRGLVLVVR